MRLTPLLLSVAGFAQSPTFDVASVNPSPADKGDRIQINLGSFRNSVVTPSPTPRSTNASSTPTASSAKIRSRAPAGFATATCASTSSPKNYPARRSIRLSC